MKTKTAAIVLSGCGVFDGSEIHESVITLLNLQKLGVKAVFFAPNIPQTGVVNHLTGAHEQNPRNVLAESARIARGEIQNLSKFSADDFDMLIFVGGFGAAKNLSDYAISGVGMSVNGEVNDAIKAMYKKRKPTGFVCISPVIAAKVLGGGVKLTIGNDAQTAATVNALGARHIECAPEDFVRDDDANVYSTPAYMLAKDAAQVDKGVGAMIAAMVQAVK
jgi:putative isoprenoid biosynthesis-related protein (enhancing lycopene biosynthesis protein 2 (sigma cross-reacting protein 27a) (scrp-27a))